MTNLDETYHAQYHRDHLTVQDAFDAIAAAFISHFRPRTVADVGCSGGALLVALDKLGVQAVGIDGSVHATGHANVTIIQQDLRHPFDASRLNLPYGGADLVVCTDVGEHIEADCHEQFVRNICACIAPGGALVFGAAGEGQDGLGHVACRHCTHWIALFEDLRMKLCARESEELRSRVQADERHAGAWWIAKNLMVLRPR